MQICSGTTPVLKTLLSDSQQTKTGTSCSFWHANVYADVSVLFASLWGFVDFLSHKGTSTKEVRTRTKCEIMSCSHDIRSTILTIWFKTKEKKRFWKTYWLGYQLQDSLKASLWLKLLSTWILLPCSSIDKRLELVQIKNILQSLKDKPFPCYIQLSITSNKQRKYFSKLTEKDYS